MIAHISDYVWTILFTCHKSKVYAVIIYYAVSLTSLIFI